MSIFSPEIRARRLFALLLAVLIAATLAPSRAAFAALGENMASVAHDKAMLRGTLSVVPMQTYEVHEIRAASGQTVREYAARSGKVFAVTWNGTQVPNLKLLLGQYFDRYVAAARLRRTGHHLLSIRTPDLVMTAIRYQRGARGQAYVPALLPSGVTRADLR